MKSATQNTITERRAKTPMSRKKTIDVIRMPVAKRVMYAPGDPHYQGVYVRKDRRNVLTWYLNIRIEGKSQWIKVGNHVDGFGPDHVVAKRQELQLAKFNGTVPQVIKKDQSCTLDEAFTSWIKWTEQAGSSEGYVKAEMNRYDKHVRPVLGSMQLKELCEKPQLINSLQDRLRKKAGLAANSIKQIMMDIQKSFQQALADGTYFGPVPFRKKNDPQTSGVVIKSSKARRERWLTRDQAVAFMEYLQELSQRNHPVWAEAGRRAYQQAAFALYTGLRKSEVMRLERRSINLDTMQIYVDKVKHATMADKSRYVDIPGVLVPIIEDLLAEKPRRPNERLFKTFARKPLEMAFDHFGFNDGIDPRDTKNRMSLHNLRHTFGSLHVENGTHLVTIKEMMGHDTIEAVQIYAKAGENLRKISTDNFNKIW